MCLTCSIVGLQMQQVLHGELGENGAVISEDVDAAANTSTIYTMEVGDTFAGAISQGYDEDWVAIELTAGETIIIAQDGSSLPDPLVRLYSGTGTLLATDDDGGPGLNSLLTYTPTSSGTYYISAEAYSDNFGAYNLSVREVGAPPPPNDFDPLQALDWGGAKLSSNTINVFFGQDGFTAGGVTSEGWNAFEMAQMMRIFDLLESVADVEFNIVTSSVSADFRLIMDDGRETSGVYGYFSPPGTANAGLGVFNDGLIGDEAGSDLEVGGFGFMVFMHEVLHGMGLSHPHDTGGGSEVLDGVSSSRGDYGSYDLNQGIYTTMSYNAGYHAGAVGTAGDPNAIWGYNAGAMALDIAVLQQAYGANTTYASGNNIYYLPDSNTIGTHWQSIWDTGGADQIRYDGATAATIDLRAATLQGEVGGGGYVSAVNGIAGGYTIANGANIEKAMGGSGNDTITGNDLNNRLSGREGDNVISGGLGNDTVNVGSGDDTIFGGGGDDLINGFAGNDSIDAGNGVDVVKGGNGNDFILGGQGNDRLNGGGWNDTIDGGDGDDQLIGGNGNDSIIGGDGDDGFFGQNGMDTLMGGDGNDTVRGGGGEDQLSGGDGDDTLFGGRANDTMSGGEGDDSMVGGAGNDDMAGEAGDDLISGAIGDDSIKGGDGDDLINGNQGSDTLLGGLGGDTLNGGLDEDHLFGSIGNDALRGGGGNDYLNGGTGNDSLNSGSGNDTLIGGTGDDTFVFKGSIDDDVITDFTLGDTLRIHSNLLSGQTTGTDLFTRYGNFENGGVMLDFENGNSIFLDGVTSLTNPDDAILIYG